MTARSSFLLELRTHGVPPSFSKPCALQFNSVTACLNNLRVFNFCACLCLGEALSRLLVVTEQELSCPQLQWRPTHIFIGDSLGVICVEVSSQSGLTLLCCQQDRPGWWAACFISSLLFPPLWAFPKPWEVQENISCPMHSRLVPDPAPEPGKRGKCARGRHLGGWL